MLKGMLLTIAGFVLLALGAIGIFLPVWPTTPFVLLAVASFSVNPAMQRHILKIKFIEEHLNNYKYRTGLRRRNVAASLVFLWTTMGISMAITKSLQITVTLLLIGLAVTVHLLWISRPKRK